MLSLKPENVRCIFVEGAGCYGRNGADDCSSEAAVIAREIGRPVRLQWMRQDEHGWDPKGPPVVLDYRASIDDQGQITAWESDMFHARATDSSARVRRCSRPCSPELPKMRFPGSATPQLGTRHSLCVAEQQADGALARSTHRCLRRGFARRATCKIRSATRASSTKSRRPPASIRSRSEFAISRIRAGLSSSSACAPSRNGNRAARARAMPAPSRAVAV